MSSKSDRDNRSNQLNPNNDAYWDSRRNESDSDDDGVASVLRADPISQAIRDSLRLHSPARPEWVYGEYFMAIVAFDGKTRHVRFKTKVRNDMSNWPAGGIVESVWHAQLQWMAEECRLGVAYARIAGSEQGEKHHKFIWNNPKIEASQLERERGRLSEEKDRLGLAEERMQAIQPGSVPSHDLALFRSMASIPYNSALTQVRNLTDTIARAEAWYSSVRDLADKLEKAFEWNEHAVSEDLGVLTDEIDFDAPSPYLDRARNTQKAAIAL